MHAPFNMLFHLHWQTVNIPFFFFFVWTYIYMYMYVQYHTIVPFHRYQLWQQQHGLCTQFVDSLSYHLGRYCWNVHTHIPIHVHSVYTALSVSLDQPPASIACYTKTAGAKLVSTLILSIEGSLQVYCPLSLYGVGAVQSGISE